MTTLLANTKVGDVSPALVKTCAMNLWKLRSAQPFDLSAVLGASVEEITPLWQIMVKSGCIEQAADGRHYPTDDMRLLATARIMSNAKNSWPLGRDVSTHAPASITI